LSFPITLLTFTPSVITFAEAWEYDEEEGNMVEGEHADLAGDRRHAFHLKQECTRSRWEGKDCGVLEKKADMMYIGGEVVIGKEAEGDVKVWQECPCTLCC
jgi:dynactin-4